MNKLVILLFHIYIFSDIISHLGIIVLVWDEISWIEPDYVRSFRIKVKNDKYENKTLRSNVA